MHKHSLASRHLMVTPFIVDLLVGGKCLGLMALFLYMKVFLINTLATQLSVDMILERSGIKSVLFIIKFSAIIHLMQCDFRYSKGHNRFARMETTPMIEHLIFSYPRNSISKPESGNPTIFKLKNQIGEYITIFMDIIFLYR